MKRDSVLSVMITSLFLVFCAGNVWAQGTTSTKNGKSGKSAVFSHAQHYGAAGGGKIKECTDCHRYSQRDQNFSRPGARPDGGLSIDHKPCSDSGCHDKENYKSTDASAAFCQNCHYSDPKKPGGYALHEFPDPRKGFIALENFQHRNHINTSFGKINCDNCHALKTNGKAGLPAHKECGQCHGDKAGANVVAPLMNSRAKSKDCLGCHTDAANDGTVRQARVASWGASQVGEYSRDVIFSHNKHLSHPQAKQSCSECHVGVENSGDLSKPGSAIYLPTMFSCETCHKDNSRVTAANNIDNCAACHEDIRKKEKPRKPLHYGKGEHYQGGAQRPSLYCAYCHDRDLTVFAVKQVYAPGEACESCHKAYAVQINLGSPEETENLNSSRGVIQRKNGFFPTFNSRFDLKQVDSVASPLDQIDAQDTDFYQLVNFDSYDMWRQNLGVSFSGRFSLDAGNTPAQSPFASQFNLDQNSRDERGRFVFNNDNNVFVNEDFDRIQSSSVLIYRLYAELRDQDFKGKKADFRIGRQSVFESAEPWLLFDGGYARFKLGDKKVFNVEVFGGTRASLYTADNFRPLLGANLTATLSPKLTLKLQDVAHVANSTKAVVESHLFPNLHLHANVKLGNFAPEYAQAGFFFYNPEWGTQMVFEAEQNFGEQLFDYDYTSLSTRGGADLLLADPALGGVLATNAQAQAAFDQFSADRAEDAKGKIGKQIFDFENFNLFPLAPHQRLELIFSQKMASKVFLNLGFRARFVDGALRNNAENIAANLDLNSVDQGELAVISDLVAEDNRFAFTYPYLELEPGLDFYDVGLKGLHLGFSARLRQAESEDVRLLFGNNTFFNDISGENDNNGLSLDAEISQSLGKGKIRFGALFGLHRYDYVGRYVVVDDLGNPVTDANDVGEQNAGLVNLNSFSASAWFRLRLREYGFLRALYTAETDLEFFPDDPFITSQQSGFAGGNLENNSYDAVLLQRLNVAIGFTF